MTWSVPNDMEVVGTAEIRLAKHASYTTDNLKGCLGKITIKSTATDGTMTTWSRDATASIMLANSPSDPNNAYAYWTDLPRFVAGYTYEMVVEAKGEMMVTSLHLEYVPASDIKYELRNQETGGLRIKTIASKASATAPALIRSYRYTRLGSSLSSGYLVSSLPPVYLYQQLTYKVGQHISQGGGHCAVTVVSSSSPGEVQSGSQPVAYHTVTVTDSSATTGQTLGKTVSQYSAYVDGGNNDRPYPPAVTAPWKRGNLLTQYVYAGSHSGGFRLVEKKVNDYASEEEEDTKREVIRGAKVIPNKSFVSLGGIFPEPSAQFIGHPLFTGRFARENTYQYNAWHYITATHHYKYDPTNEARYVETSTRYYYDNKQHAQPTRIERSIAGGTEIKRIAYVLDCGEVTTATTEEAKALRQMIQRHIYSVPVETTTSRLTAQGILLTQATLTLPRLVNGIPQPSRQLSWRATAPQPESSFQRMRVAAGGVTFDPQYREEVLIDRYTAQMQVEQMHQAKGPATSYLWDALSQEPAAVVKNASFSEIAYTSFEPGAAGNWSYTSSPTTVVAGGRTGQQCYQFQPAGVVSTTVGRTDQYTFTCWATAPPTVLVNGIAVAPTSLVEIAKASGSQLMWKQYTLRHSLVAGATLTVQGPAGLQVDELRLHPVGAQMTSYTYQPLTGMSSQTGPDGRTVFYEYDGLGRLSRVRDEQGRILTQNQYQYAQ
ncbi:hypothetical protein E5K02_20290 [Hymenobacter metallicola]|uniref:RHS repeat protein n=2 Tax=Hymenobacter metallicola TaxID=2563114 RepID=A0A4Z0Q0R6_9BACT|nr:hypothetical protein E5K02_20290 [Hymenobacter metallicola]